MVVKNDDFENTLENLGFIYQWTRAETDVNLYKYSSLQCDKYCDIVLFFSSSK